MQNYKDLNGSVHALDDVAFENLLPDGCIRISQREADEAGAPTVADTLRTQIAALEVTATPRRLREALLGIDDGWLLALDEQIALLRAQL